MNTLLLVSWLCLPIAPLNPIEEDTLAAYNLHIAVGLSNPNGIISAGPTLSAAFEMLLVHPIMARATVDFKYGRVSSNLYPKGDLYSMIYGVDAIYYRGTNHLTGYIGFGFIYAFHHFEFSASAADSLLRTESVIAVDVQQEFGYRLTLGLRYHRSYSLEISVSELYPDIKKTGVDAVGGESRMYEETRTGSFNVALGYLFEI
jgi:hypothetical protein